MGKYIFYFLVSYLALTTLIFLAQYFEIFNFDGKSNGFTFALIIASTALPAIRFAKDFERAPETKEKLIFSFGSLFGVATIEMIIFLFVYPELLAHINITAIALITFLYLLNFLGIFYFFGNFIKNSLKTKK